MSARAQFKSRRALALGIHYDWGFDALPRDAADALEQLLAAVDELSYEQWLRIGRESLTVDGRADEHSIARDHLVTAISDQRLQFVDWFVHDSVDCAAQQTLLAACSRDRKARVTVLAAREALSRALMAVALRDSISESDYDALWVSCRTSIAM